MRLTDNIIGLKTKRGPAYERWLQALARGIVREARKVDTARDEG